MKLIQRVVIPAAAAVLMALAVATPAQSFSSHKGQATLHRHQGNRSNSRSQHHRSFAARTEKAVRKYLRTNPREFEKIVEDYLKKNPPAIEKIVKDYLQANPPVLQDTTQRADIQKIVKDYLAENPQSPQDITRQTIVSVMKDYLMTNPQFLQDVISELDKQQKVASAEKARTAIKANNATIFNSPHEVVLGNPNGKVTMVEFFDYNCGYCKHALPDMMKLLQTNSNLRFVLKEFPVLGEGSVEAAHVAVAARMQDPTGVKYIEFHQKLLGGRGAADKMRALAVAKEVGLDMGRLMKDMDSEEVKTTIAENLKLADTLGIDGTPSYVVGDELVVGAVGYDELEKKIAALRK